MTQSMIRSSQCNSNHTNSNKDLNNTMLMKMTMTDRGNNEMHTSKDKGYGRNNQYGNRLFEHSKLY